MKFASSGATGVLAVCLLASTPALANSTGQTGYSGLQNRTCNQCHTGGAAPTVELTGPTTLNAGETGQYSLIIRGGPAAVAGTNVAVSGGTLSTATGSGLKKVGSELTHSGPKSFSNGEARFDFSLTAPSTGGTVKLYGVGNSANGNSNMTGDGVVARTLDITVAGGADGGTGDGGGDDNDGGCSATGGAPFLLLSLLGAGLLSRRRD